MIDKTSPPYPSETELKATNTPVIVAFFVIVATIAALCVEIALWIVGIAQPAWVIPTTLLAGIILLFATAAVAARKPKGRAKNLTGHPPTTSHTILTSSEREAVDRITNRITNERNNQ